MSIAIKVNINDALYLRDPQETKLGKKIIQFGIELIDKLGLEAFTFKKLADRIGSTESSIYRYFENKHKLLLYLSCWYWGWMEYRLVFSIANIPSAEEKLTRAIRLLTEEVAEDSAYNHINEVKLDRIIISESSKAYLTREVDEENKEGAFAGYKTLVARVSELILSINPNYLYPHMLVSTVMEGAHHQRYFAEHLPRLTDAKPHEDTITQFYLDLVMKTIQ